MLIKLYKNIGNELHYFEAWWDASSIEVVTHQGKVGSRGTTAKLEKVKVYKAITKFKHDGYTSIDLDDHFVLMIEYKVDGMGTDADLQKRRALQNRMDQVLGWIGLGECDGGNIGSGTMEVCCFVVDFDIAKAIIEVDLEGTEFDDYERIYDENA